MAIFSSKQTIRINVIHRPKADNTDTTLHASIRGGRGLFQVHPPVGGLWTPCQSVIKHPPRTHILFSPTERGSRQLGRQTCWGTAGVGGKGSMLIEVVRECVFPPRSPAAKSTSANSLSAVTLSPSPAQHTHTHRYTKSWTQAHTHLSYPKGMLTFHARWVLSCPLISSCFSFTAHLNHLNLAVPECVCACVYVSV